MNLNHYLIILFISFSTIKYYGSDSTKDRILNDANKMLSIAINVNIINTEPINIDKYLTDIEKEMKDKAILNDFLNTWTGKRSDFQNQVMVECGHTFSSGFNYSFSHKDDVIKLKSDFENLNNTLKTYNLTIQFDKFQGKKTDLWGTGRSDQFIKYQNNTLWWQIDKVTQAIWKALMYMQIKYEKVIAAQEINNFIHALENFENQYNVIVQTISELKNTIKPTNMHNTSLNFNKNNPQEIYFLLEEYALKIIKNEIYTTEYSNIKTTTREEVNNLTKNIQDYKKNPIAWECPKNYLIQFKEAQYKEAGRTISEKLVPGICSFSTQSKTFQETIKEYQEKEKAKHQLFTNIQGANSNVAQNIKSKQ